MLSCHLINGIYFWPNGREVFIVPWACVDRFPPRSNIFDVFLVVKSNLPFMVLLFGSFLVLGGHCVLVGVFGYWLRFFFLHLLFINAFPIFRGLWQITV